MSNTAYESQDLLKRRCEYDKEWRIHALEHVGQAINLAVERFANIGELIANDNEVKDDMFNSCKIAKDAGKSIQHLCEISAMPDTKTGSLVAIDQEAIVFACRSLFSALTRILLLVDIAVVKKLLTNKKQVARSLMKIDSILNFSDFVRAFSQLGNELVELAFLTGHQERYSKEERRKAQMHSARLILERSITVLLTASKASLVHRECMLAKENRDTIFCQIRRAMDLIHFVVKDSIFGQPQYQHYASSSSEQHSSAMGYKNCEKGTVHASYKDFLYCLEGFHYKAISQEHSICKAGGGGGGGSGGGNNNYASAGNPLLIENNWPIENKSYDWSSMLETYGEGGNNYLNEHVKSLSLIGGCGSGAGDIRAGDTKEELLYALDKLLEKIQDFTDCAYTSHEHRQKILFLSYRCKLEVNKYLNRIADDDCSIPQGVGGAKLINDTDGVVSVVKRLSEQLVLSVNDQVIDLYQSIKMSVNLAKSFYVFALKQDLDQLQELADRFHDYCDHIIDVCKLLRHIACDARQVEAKYLAINLRTIGPQVLTAANILAKYPGSTSASENYEAFLEIWKWLTAEIITLTRKILNLKEDFKDTTTSKECTNLLQAPQMPTKLVKPTYKDELMQDKSPTGRKDGKDAAAYNRGNAPAPPLAGDDKWNTDLSDNNDILKRAKNMSAMAFSMYQFTKGNGALRTTQDLFTQAEYFAEEANRLYKILRQFSYQVPAGDNKKELLNILDRVPTFVQTLQFTVKDHTVGKAATFVKVDHTLRETKNLMNVINKVVNSCFECANKYNLDFSGLSGGVTSGLRGEDNSSGGMSDSKGGASNSTEGSM